jgi:D-alanyl-D-alanine dipeptidase
MSSELYEIVDARWSRPVPLQDEARKLKVGYREHPINQGNPLFHEPLVEVSELGIIGVNHYWVARNPPVPGAIRELLLRKSVGRKLRGVDRCLSQHGIGLFVKDAYRPLAVQQHIFDHYQRQSPGLVASPGGGEDSPPPHLTGAAVDVVLYDLKDGRELNMGKADEPGNIHPDFFELERGRMLSMWEQEARGNRRLLIWIMLETGFVVNPTEWWHFSYGDQMWARLTGEPAAFYGAAEFQ